MNSPLRVLHLEDDPRDTELIQAALETEGIPIGLTRVDTEQDFVLALNRGSFDLILADYTLPSFDGLSALRIAQQQVPNVPFLFVSGTLGEDVAIEALKTGATDYILKTRLSRLGPSLTRALREARERTERQRAEALLAGEKRILEMVAKGDSLAEILDSLCRLGEENAKGVLASILLVESNRLRHGGAPSLPTDYTAAIDGAVIGPCAGSCGTAAFRGEQVIVEDIATDPLWADYREAALPHSLRACWSTPVFSSQGKVIATFAMYYREPRSPSLDDQKIIEQITHLAGIAIERKLTQERLKQSEAYLAEAQKLSRTGNWARNARNGDELYCSDELLRIFGFDPEEHVPTVDQFTERIHPEDRDTMQERAEQGLREKADYVNDFRIVLPDGTLKYIEGTAHPVLNAAGELVEYVGTAVDVTERRRAEEALREGERRYRNIFEGAGVSIWEEDFSQVKAAIDKLKAGGVQDFRQYLAEHPEFVRQASSMVKVVEVNEATLKLFGAGSKEELLGSLEKILVPETAEDFAGELVAIAEGRSSFEAETVLQTLKGERLTVLFTITFPAERPQLDRVLVSITDISDRKRAEALQSGEKRLLEMIATGAPLPEIFHALCIIIEEQRRGTIASVLLLNADGAHLDFVAGPSLPKRWARQMETMPIGPCAGSCGTAAYRGTPVIVSDIATDPLWDVPEHRSAALRHGLRASWSNPVLTTKGEVLGTFCMYYRDTRTPTAQDLELIELATHLIRGAIERDRAQEAVRASEQVARGQVDALMQSLDVLATTPAPDKFLGQMLLSIGRQLQATRVLLWLRSDEDEKLRLRLGMEGEQQIVEDPEHPFVKDPYAWKRVGFWQEMLFTGGPIVCEEIDEDPRLGEEMRAYLTRKGVRKFLIVPVLVTGEVRGFIGIHHQARDPYRSEEIELAQALAHQVMLAIQLTQLAEQGRHAAILEERTRMARDIHDTLAQGFTGVVLQMEAAEAALSDEAPDDAIQHVRRARELARESLGEARRSVHALRSKALENAGFWDALRGIIRNTTLGTPLQTGFRLEGDVRELAPHVEENLLHIGQEALTNALKHAQATRFETRLAFEPNAVCLELRDNGSGFVTNGANGGFGLIGMRERVEKIGGTLTVTSACGEGTTIVAIAPYQEKGTT